MDANYISVSEAAQITERSQGWVRGKLKSLEKDGYASRNDVGQWEINRNAIVGLKVTKRKGASVTTNNNTTTNEGPSWSLLVEALRNDAAGLRVELRKMSDENTELRNDLRLQRIEFEAALIEKDKPSGLLSRFLKF